MFNNIFESPRGIQQTCGGPNIVSTTNLQSEADSQILEGSNCRVFAHRETDED